MKKLFLAASVLFSVIPGLAILTKQGGLLVPPGEIELFSGVTEIIGVLTLLTLALNKAHLQKIVNLRKNSLVIKSMLLFFFFLSLYLLSLNASVFEYKERRLFLPLILVDGLKDRVHSAGGRYAAIERYGPAEIYESAKSTDLSIMYLTATTIWLLLLYQLMVLSVVIPYGIIGLSDEQKSLMIYDIEHNDNSSVNCR